MKIEHLLPDIRRDAGAVISDPDFNRVTEVFRGRGQGRLETLTAGFLALVGSAKAVGNEIEEHPRDLLGIKVDHSGRWIEVMLQHNVEAGFLCARRDKRD